VIDGTDGLAAIVFCAVIMTGTNIAAPAPSEIVPMPVEIVEAGAEG
jgi:hypothetical protein